MGLDIKEKEEKSNMKRFSCRENYEALKIINLGSLGGLVNEKEEEIKEE